MSESRSALPSVSNKTGVRRVEDGPAGDEGVRGYLHTPANAPGAGLVLTHGAGANCDSPLLVAMATAFCESGLSVLRCDLPFRQLRPQGPPVRSAERDQRGLRRAVQVMRGIVNGRVFLGGHSYGGRQGSMLATAEPGLADALLLLSYPLHPPKRPGELRTAHFPDLRTPSFFAHGTRDGFGTIDEMHSAIQLIPTRTEMLVVESAGHELLNARNRTELPHKIGEAFETFAATL
jgi:hypothetical protein